MDIEKEYKEEIEFIKEMQGGVIPNSYDLTDTLWFMNNFAGRKAKNNESLHDVMLRKLNNWKALSFFLFGLKIGDLIVWYFF